jgi:hypothetical protein
MTLSNLSLYSEILEALKPVGLTKIFPSDLGDARVLGRHLCGPCKLDESMAAGTEVYWHHGLYVGKYFGHSIPQVIQMGQKGFTFVTVEEFAGMQLFEVVYEDGTCLDPDRTMDNVKKVYDNNNACPLLYYMFCQNCQHFVTLCKTGKYGPHVPEFFRDISRLCTDKEIIPFVRKNNKIFFASSQIRVGSSK